MRACPFCGYDEGWPRETPYQKPIKYIVQCSVCGASGPESNTPEMAEKKWDGLLAKIDDNRKFKEALSEEAIGGVSTPIATLNNTPGVGNATPAAKADGNAMGSGDKWSDDDNLYDQNGKLKKKKKINEFDYNAWLINAAQDMADEGYDIDTVANFIAQKINPDLYEDILDDLLDDSMDSMEDPIEFIVNKYSKVNEMNLNPYDKIGAMMAKKMGVKQPFKKKDSRTNTVEQNQIDEKSKTKFKIETLDDYAKASKYVPDHSLTSKRKTKVNEEELRNENNLKDVHAKETLETLGIAFKFKEAKSGKDRVFITEPMKNVLTKLKQGAWEEYGKNPENTIRKYKKGDQILTIYADGEDFPRATVTSEDVQPTSESLIINRLVPNSIKAYIK